MHLGSPPLVELEQLTEAQYHAAVAGRIDRVAVCLRTRQGMLARLAEAHVAPARLRALAAVDVQTAAILRAQLQHLGGELARLREGGRALHGYRTPVQSSPGFMDQVQ